jgi:hypothetical protein
MSTAHRLELEAHTLVVVTGLGRGFEVARHPSADRAHVESGRRPGAAPALTSPDAVRALISPWRTESILTSPEAVFALSCAGAAPIVTSPRPVFTSSAAPPDPSLTSPEPVVTETAPPTLPR